MSSARDFKAFLRRPYRSPSGVHPPLTDVDAVGEDAGSGDEPIDGPSCSRPTNWAPPVPGEDVVASELDDALDDGWLTEDAIEQLGVPQKLDPFTVDAPTSGHPSAYADSGIREADVIGAERELLMAREAIDELSAHVADEHQMRLELAAQLTEERRRYAELAAQAKEERQRHDELTVDVTEERRRFEALLAQTQADRQRYEELVVDVTEERRRQSELKAQMDAERRCREELEASLEDTTNDCREKLNDMSRAYHETLNALRRAYQSRLDKKDGRR